LANPTNQQNQHQKFLHDIGELHIIILPEMKAKMAAAEAMEKAIH